MQELLYANQWVITFCCHFYGFRKTKRPTVSHIPTSLSNCVFVRCVHESPLGK